MCAPRDPVRARAGDFARVPPLEIRVGLPSPGGAIAAAARALGLKTMLSANSFLIRDEDHDLARLRRPGPALEGLDAALDSGGFVSASRYGSFPCPIDLYVRGIVAVRPWTWYSQPDLACEPGVREGRVDVRLRQAASVAAFVECRRAAADRGLPGPVPVLQGWHPEDYHRSWEMLPLWSLPPLVGVGSVCRRPVHGRLGLMSVLHRLDRVLPPGVQLHLFGVKSEGVEALVGEAALDGRVRSVDSMAWDFEARSRFRTGRTVARRVAVMRAWYERQVSRARAAASRGQYGLSPAPGDAAPDPPEGSAAIEEIVALVAAGEMDLVGATRAYEFAIWDGRVRPDEARSRAETEAPARRPSRPLACAGQESLPLAA